MAKRGIAARRWGAWMLYAAGVLMVMLRGVQARSRALTQESSYTTGSPGDYRAGNFTDLRDHLANAAAALILVTSDVLVESTLVVSRAVVIRGACPKAACVLSRAPSGQVMRVQAGVQGVLLDNIELALGYNIEAAALYLGNHSSTTMYSSFITSNSAGANGDVGAVYFDGTARAEFYDCTFRANRANIDESTGVGGALYLRRQSTAIFRNCYFLQNGGAMGGAVYMIDRSFAEFTACRFFYNFADQAGGGVFIGGAASAKFLDCNFLSNNGARGGAMYIADEATVTVTKTNFTGNSATESGGAVAVYEAGDELQERSASVSPTVTFLGCLWTDNVATGASQTRDVFADGVYNTLQYSSFSPTSAPTFAPTVSPEVYVSDPHEFIAAINDVNVQVVVIMKAIDFAQFSPDQFVFSRDMHIEGNPEAYDDMHLLGSATVYFTITNNATVSMQFLRLQDFGVPGSANGAIVVDSYSSFVGRDVNFMYNNAAETGGALTMKPRSNAACLVCNFNSNRARLGGAIHVGHHSQLTCNECMFSDNQGEQGKDIYVDQYSTMTLQGPDQQRCAEISTKFQKHTTLIVTPVCETFDFSTDYESIALFAFLASLFTAAIVLFGRTCYNKVNQMMGVMTELGDNLQNISSLEALKAQLEESAAKLNETPHAAETSTGAGFPEQQQQRTANPLFAEHTTEESGRLLDQEPTAAVSKE